MQLFRYGATVTEVPGPAGTFGGYDLPLGRPDEAWGWPYYSIPLDPGLTDGDLHRRPRPAARRPDPAWTRGRDTGSGDAASSPPIDSPSSSPKAAM
jgi:hypothetical protein